MGRVGDETENWHHRAALSALAELLAARIEVSAASGAGTLAQESAQYRAVMAELRAMPFSGVVPKGGGKVVSADEARLRREVRRATAEAEPDAKVGGSKRR